jgi:hypothetical protein
VIADAGHDVFVVARVEELAGAKRERGEMEEVRVRVDEAGHQRRAREVDPLRGGARPVTERGGIARRDDAAVLDQHGVRRLSRHGQDRAARKECPSAHFRPLKTVAERM